MLSSNLVKAVLSLLLAAAFGVVSAGAFADGRGRAIPLALIFAALAISCLVKMVGFLRHKGPHA